MAKPLIDRETSERLQRDGANARALGQSFLDSPFYETRNMPRTTGEPTEVWAAKEAAWRFGWEIEDRMRPSAADELLAAIERRRAGMEQMAQEAVAAALAERGRDPALARLIAGPTRATDPPA